MTKLRRFLRIAVDSQRHCVAERGALIIGQSIREVREVMGVLHSIGRFPLGELGGVTPLVNRLTLAIGLARFKIHGLMANRA
jgi:hypothetical protein